jgi:predicted phosphohydrolase
MGKLLIIVGFVCILLGVLITYSPKLPFLGKLPGDITIDKGNFKFYFPLGTSILLSILISLLIYLYQRYKN